MSDSTNGSGTSMSLRVIVVVALLLGSLALVFPKVADFAGGLMGSAPEASAEKESPENTKSAGPNTASGTRGAKPNARPETNAAWNEPVDAPQLSASFSDYRPTDSNGPGASEKNVRTASSLDEVTDSNSTDPELRQLQSDLERLGATYMVVEQVAGSEMFECRCLVNLSARSSYSRAFSAEGTSPAEAATAVIDQVRKWRRAQAKLDSSKKPTEVER